MIINRIITAALVIPLILGSAACSEQSIGAPDSAVRPDSVDDNTGAVTGVVAERTPEGLRPMASVTVFAWVQTGPNGYSRGGVQTDAKGRYRVDLLPIGSTVFLSPSYPESYDQPCASIAEISAPSTTMDIELVSVDHPLPDAATSPSLIRGVVYEIKGNLRQPVPGARLAFDVGADMRGANDGGVVVTTTTDESGRYALCRLPSRGELHVVKDTYESFRQVIDVTGSSQLDIELELTVRAP